MNLKYGNQKMSLKKLLRSFFIENTFLCCMMMVLFLLVAFMSMFRPIVVGYMFHHGYQWKNINQLADYGKVLLSMNVLIIILSAIRSVLYTRFEIKILSQLQTVVMKKILQLPVYFFDHYTTGELVHRVLWIVSLSQLFGSNQMGLFFSFLSLLISFSVMFYFNWQLTCVVFLLTVFFTLFAIWSSARLLPRLAEHAKDMGQAYGFMYQVINGITRIKLFARQACVESLWDSTYVYFRNRLQDTYGQGAWGYAFFNAIPLLLLMIIFALGGMQQYSLSYHFVIFFCGLSLLMTGIATFYINAGGLLDALIAYWRMEPIFSAPLEQEESVANHNQIPASDFINNIRIKDLYFTYPDSKRAILRQLDCQISFGQHVAFVGLSGSGKSTLLKLLLGFYFPQQGQIEINGQRLQDIDLLNFRSSIGVVLQDAQLMNGTILENIIGHSAATEQDAWRILSELDLSQFITSLPMGIHTAVSHYMNLLSGGQKQMLLIARALVGNPRLLLLDEATNSLDNRAQEMITNRINQLGMTRITIAHRLSTVKKVDKIFVLHQGKIAQQGTYQQLSNQEGLFHQLVRSQTLGVPS